MYNFCFQREDFWTFLLYIVLLNLPLLKLRGPESIHNIYNVPLEPERAAKARRVVVASGGYTKIIAIRDFFQLDRSQCSYSSREAFPCESDSASKKSFYKPKSVHKLRPGDLDVVAGLGDGLVAASGALSSTYFQES